MSRKRILAAVGFGLLAVMAYRLAAHASAIDGFSGIIGAMVGEDTVYTAGYSDSGWNRIRLGMSRSQVEGILGPPQKEWPLKSSTEGPDLGARWSYSPGDTNFRCRVLLFRRGAVVEKHAEFYFD